ncbi:MAG: hypothetical protein ABS99_05575 [Acetobacteraceae bacterium SCN 69-10]|nr:hypothetical protein [Rhodospirillales bacterium]ODU56730.1 MAG: hypothetical protein ABS99_05575 [Acetobacteraceae bacterium SCN 69-10]OJY78385.1 MAG: hypothetical protein BGP12_00640 [Rhodospirillales bacterium 70-18]
MRALKVLVVVMGVLIVAGVATLGVVIARRVSGPSGPAVSAMLDEPAGTRIAAIAVAPDHTVLLLHGGGPDRVVSVDARSGKVVGRVGLTQ